MPIRNVSQGHAATPTLTTNSTGSSSAQPSSSQLDDAILDTSVAPNNFATSLPLESWNISGQQSLALPDAPAPDAYLSPAQSTGLADGVALAQQEIVWMLNNPGLTNSLFTTTTDPSGCVNPMPEYTPVDYYSAEDISTTTTGTDTPATDYHDHLLALFRNDFSNSDGVNAGLLPPSPNGLPTSVDSTSALFGADTKGSVTTVLQEDAENNEAELLFDDYIALDMLQ
ncbi:hypothetical protein AX16_010523 [Volvariella volvacea WC 439]|nr:hypothetical protein AX16_010523 [Volvariella volvacea WC 439]